MPIPSYSDGAISIENGSAALIGTDTAWSTQVKPGDIIVHVPADAAPEIAGFASVVTGDLAITLADTYNGATLAAAPYRIVRGIGWLSGAAPNETLITFLTELGPLGLAGVSAGIPSPTTGRNNELRFDEVNGVLYQKSAGSWVARATGLEFDARGDVTAEPSDRDQYDGEAAHFTFFSLTEGGFYFLIAPADPDTETAAVWSSLVSLKGSAGATVEEVLTELGVGHITISEDDPSGGEDNDIWFKVGG
jgi:hypothetical protein